MGALASSNKMERIHKYILIFLIVFIFIVGEILWGKHIYDRAYRDNVIKYTITNGSVIECNLRYIEDCSCDNITYSEITFLNNFPQDVSANCVNYFENLNMHDPSTRVCLFYWLYNAFGIMMIICFSRCIITKIKETNVYGYSQINNDCCYN